LRLLRERGLKKRTHPRTLFLQIWEKKKEARFISTVGRPFSLHPRREKKAENVLRMSKKEGVPGMVFLEKSPPVSSGRGRKERGSKENLWKKERVTLPAECRNSYAKKAADLKEGKKDRPRFVSPAAHVEERLVHPKKKKKAGGSLKQTLRKEKYCCRTPLPPGEFAFSLGGEKGILHGGRGRISIPIPGPLKRVSIT